MIEQASIPALAKKVIEETIAETMAAYGLRQVNITPGVDHDGDPVLFIEAEYDLTNNPVDPTVTAALTSILRDRLWNEGETRFPHVRHKFDEAQKVAGRKKRVGT